jgi:hypothetical protein
VLAVHGDGPTAGQTRQVDAMAAASERDVQPLVPHALTGEPFADAGLVHQVDRALFEHARPNALDDMVPTAILDDDRVDAALVEEVPEHEPGRTGADDADLRAGAGHRSTRSSTMAMPWPTPMHIVQSA